MRRVLRALVVVAILAAAGWLQMNASVFEDMVRNAVDDPDDDDVVLLPLQQSERWLVLVIDFPSKPSGIGSDPSRVELMLTGERAADDYVFQMSGGASELEIVVHPEVYTAASDPGVYGVDEGGQRDVGTEGAEPATLVTEAVTASLSGTNLSQFDLDGDGRLDRLLIMHTGRAQENGGTSSDIWSHFSYLMDPVTVNGTEVAHYTMASFESGLGTILHEMVHQMGAIDLYDVHSDLPTNNWNGVGDWDIMASGNWNGNGRDPALPMAATLRLIGADRDHTIDPESLLDGPVTFNLTPLSAGGMTVRIQISPDEWVWIEHRGDIGFDRELPGAGVLVSHQDDGVGDLSSNEVNNDPNEPWLRIIEADGDDGLVRGVDSGRQSDMFAAGASFGSEGVEIRDRRGRIVDWRGQVESLNPTVATITITRTQHSGDVLPPRSPIELMDGETIPLLFTADEACMPWSMLTTSDGRQTQLLHLKEIEAGGQASFQLGWIDSVQAPAGGTINGSFGCGDGAGRAVTLDWHLVSHRITTTEWSGEIHWQRPTSLEVPLSFEGDGARVYDIVIEGPLERIASTPVQQTLSNGSTISIEVSPNGLLVRGMLADGEVVLVDEAGIERRISLNTVAVEDEPEDAYSWFRQPVNAVTLLLLLLALTVLTSGERRRPSGGNESVRPADPHPLSYESLLGDSEVESFDRQHLQASFSTIADPFADSDPFPATSPSVPSLIDPPSESDRGVEPETAATAPATTQPRLMHDPSLAAFEDRE